LLLRPGRIFSDEERQLAEALRVYVLDARQTMDFFRKLSEFCGIKAPLPPQLADAQKELDLAKANGVIEAFTATSWSRSISSETPLETILPLDSSLETLTQDLRQDWIAYRVDQTIWIRGKNSLNLPRYQLQEKLQEIFSGIQNISLGEIWCSKDKTTYHLPIRFSSSCAIGSLKRFLANFTGKSLFTAPPQ
ncbi:MAG: hypothetical protein NZ602_08390, partial [Thermoguttaceae bacterium]|nr:hypothetical protein [Thermoguttaceae bacterium]